MYKNADGIWEADFRREGVARLHLSYGTRKKDEATRLDAAMRRLYREKNTAVVEAVRAGTMTVHQVARLFDEGKPLAADVAAGVWPSVRDAVEQYTDWMEANPKKSNGTLLAASRQLARFVEYLGDAADQPLDTVTTRKVSDFQASLSASNAAVNTTTAILARVGALFRWHRDTELRDAQEAKREARSLHIPIDPDTISTERTGRTRFLAESEAERLLAACPGRLLCPVAVGLFAGLRVDEVMHLRPGFDIDLALGLITVQVQPGWRPKSGKRRDVPIAPPLRTLLEQHLARYASEEWLVPSPTDPAKAWHRSTFLAHYATAVRNAELVQGRADPKGVVFHTLRHTFASWLVMRGVDLYTVAQLLGNSLKMVESVYGHLAPDYRQRAVDRLAGAVAIPVMPQPDSEEASL